MLCLYYLAVVFLPDAFSFGPSFTEVQHRIFYWWFVNFRGSEPTVAPNHRIRPSHANWDQHVDNVRYEQFTIAIIRILSKMGRYTIPLCRQQLEEMGAKSLKFQHTVRDCRCRISRAPDFSSFCGSFNTSVFALADVVVKYHIRYPFRY